MDESIELRRELESCKEQIASLEGKLRQAQSGEGTSNDFWECYFSSTRDVVMILDKERLITRVNRTVSGNPPEPLVGMDVLTLVPEEYKVTVGKTIRLALEEGTSGNYEISVAVNARTHWLRTSVFPLRSGANKIRGAILVAVDISDAMGALEELRRTQSHRDTLHDSIAAGIVEMGPDGRIVSANATAADFIGFRAEQMVGRLPHELNWRLELEDGSPVEFSDLPTAVAHRTGRSVRNAIRRIWFADRADPAWLLINVEPVLQSGGTSPEGVLLTFVDISREKEAEQELKKTKDELRQLAAHLQDAAERERIAIARVVHDEIGQNLVGLNLWLARLEDRPDQPPHLLKEMKEVLRRTIKTASHLQGELRPTLLNDRSLGEALDTHVRQFEKRFGIQCTLRHSKLELLPPKWATPLYRIVQEALLNVARHSGATKTSVSIRAAAKLVASVTDDGIGIAPGAAQQPDSYGILGMRERALAMGGNLEVQGLPEQGTEVRLEIPLP